MPRGGTMLMGQLRTRAYHTTDWGLSWDELQFQLLTLSSPFTLPHRCWSRDNFPTAFLYANLHLRVFHGEHNLRLKTHKTLCKPVTPYLSNLISLHSLFCLLYPDTPQSFLFLHHALLILASGTLHYFSPSGWNIIPLVFSMGSAFYHSGLCSNVTNTSFLTTLSQAVLPPSC